MAKFRFLANFRFLTLIHIIYQRLLESGCLTLSTKNKVCFAADFRKVVVNLTCKQALLD